MPNIFDNCFRITKIRFGINIELLLMIYGGEIDTSDFN